MAQTSSKSVRLSWSYFPSSRKGEHPCTAAQATVQGEVQDDLLAIFPLNPGILVRRGNRLASHQMRPIENDVISILAGFMTRMTALGEREIAKVRAEHPNEPTQEERPERL